MLIDHARDALLIVDVQRDFLPGGALAVAGGDEMLSGVSRIAGTVGAALAAAIPDGRLTLILRKGTRRDVDSYSAFREQSGPDGTRASTGLGAWLHARGVSRVFVVGLARDYCVRATAVDAAAEGFSTFVLDDLTRPVAPERRNETDEAWRQAGVRVLTSERLQR